MIYGEIGVYHGIMKVALEIAYDNVTEAEWLSSLDPIIKWFPVEELVALNEFCLSLSDEEVNILGAGEETEMEELQCRHSDRDFYSIFHGDLC